MPKLQRRQRQTHLLPAEHPDDDDGDILYDPKDFLEKNHPANDDYIRSLEHIQRNIMAHTHGLRPKQVNMLKSVFAGDNYIAAGEKHGAHPATVSKLVRSKAGSGLLNALQHHQIMLEGPNLAQRRNMLWRIARLNEIVEPKTAITAVAELNKMTFQDHQAKLQQTTIDSGTGGITIHIPQDLMPRGALD